MVKIKYDDVKDSYQLKGLTYAHLSVLYGLLTYTTLGKREIPNAAFELAEALELDGVVPCNVKVELDSDGYFSFIVS